MNFASHEKLGFLIIFLFLNRHQRTGDWREKFLLLRHQTSCFDGGTRSLANEKLQITGSLYIIAQYGRES